MAILHHAVAREMKKAADRRPCCGYRDRRYRLSDADSERLTIAGGAAIMNIIETTISGTSVRMRVANDADPAKATEWVEFQVPCGPLVLDNKTLVGNPQRQHLGAMQIAALRRAQTAVNTAIREIEAVLDG